MLRRLSLVALVAILPAAVVACTDSAPSESESDAPASPEELREVALVHIAESTGEDPSALVELGSAVTRHARSGETITEVKALRASDGAIVGVALDASGRKVDAEKALQKEMALERQALSGLDARLTAHLEGVAPDALVPVSVWVKESGYQPIARPGSDTRLSGAQLDKLSGRVREHRAEFVESLTAPVARSLKEMGIEVSDDSVVPVLYAQIPARQLREVGSWREVSAIHLREEATAALSVARQTVAANLVNNRGFTGTGVKVAAIEVGGQTNTSNPFLSLTQDTTYSCSSSHATAVAGILVSSDTTDRGVASGASLWVGGSCNYDWDGSIFGIDSELHNRATAARDWGARVFNASYRTPLSGTPGAGDKYYDGLVINDWRAVVVAAGNDGNNAYVGSPGTAYNVLTVGATDDQNTVNRSDDTMASYSSAKDPLSAHSDREKPEIAAPGTNINSTTEASPWIGGTGSGTSYAAPMVAGTAALLMQRDASLQYWPESVRAILMASAWSNIEGDGRLSEQDGAGGMRSDVADNVAMRWGGNWAGIDYTCDAAADVTLTTQSFPAGYVVRAAITWDTDPAYESYTQQPSADLDLKIVDANGQVVATSASWDNTYEIVQFTAPATGNYSLVVSKYRCSLSPRYLGWAWAI